MAQSTKRLHNSFPKKKHLRILFVPLLLIFLLCSCSNKLEPDTPTNAAMVLTQAIRSGNYEYFNTLFSEGRKNIIAKDDYSKLQQLLSSRSSLSTYELITFDNGEMFLILLTPEKENGQYYIQDIKVVPKEMQSLFK